MTFPEFLARWRADTLSFDPAWRAYDIQASVTPRCVRGALKRLGMMYAGELAIPEFMARYKVATADEACLVLGSWWLWSGIDAGRRMGVPKRAVGQGGGAVTPTGLARNAVLDPSRRRSGPF